MEEPGGFQSVDLPLDQRVADLMNRLTLAEKVALLHQHQAPVPRLGMGAFHTGTEALHGLAWLGPATVFPQAIGLASTWNPDLVERVGDAVGDEARGFHHKNPDRGGLNVWAPVVNLLRDPRWGRNEEGYSEDPLLTGVLATAYARGLRGDHPRVLKTAPTLKHFLAYNNETRRESTSSGMPPRVLREYELPAFEAPIRAGAAVAVMASYNLVNGRPAHLSPLLHDELRGWSEHDIVVVSDAQAPSNVVDAQHYYPDHVSGHAALVRAGVDSFTDNGDHPTLTVERLTTALARGLLTEADVDAAVRRLLLLRFRLGEFDPPESHPYADVTEEVINCPEHQDLAVQAARQSIVLLRNDGMLPLTLSRRDRVAVVGPLADVLYEDWYSGTLPYATTVRGGLAARFDSPDAVRFAEGVDRIALRVAPGAGTAAGRYVTADGSAHGGPLTAGADCAGPDSWLDVHDWGHGVLALRCVCNGRYLTVDTGKALANESPRPGGWVVNETFELVERGGDTVLRHFASDRYVAIDPDGALRAVAASGAEATGFAVELVSDGILGAAAVAAEADIAVVVVGNHPLINGRETEDRADLSLPPDQDRLVRAVHAANPRCVLVVTSSYPYAIGWADEHVPAILWSAHGGQEFGRALADVLFGDTAPAGRLTQTWYRHAADLPDLLDYDIIASDATYLYFRGTPLYPFGHGLTYSPVEYDNLRLSSSTVEPDGEVRISLDVTNTGARATDEVVQLYTRQRTSRVKQPVRQLRGFRRLHLAPGERTTVHFGLAAAGLAFWDVTRQRAVVERAAHDILVGRSSADIRCAATLDVAGETIPPRRALDGTVCAADFDGYAGITLCDAGPERGDAVTSTEPGAWVCFDGTDFGDGAARCAAELSRLGSGPAGITLRLDDPLDGPVIGQVTAACRAGRYEFVSAGTPLRGAAGVRDLYAVFDAPGVTLRSLSFRAGK
ncbi:glycoside hydrolase family 3 protein [Rugosimonospora africana]|uniref:Exo-alpha-(1->6)-L-arabinopyranosidase n=1 Tax=Rugosimonospora africana TaxID=556532 RepID=A0A8J3VW46_9ACTN|nr:glycoside hydrolase family 3 protein [Rugosimonospora africana]GIH20980.1 beta-glucosidase [Rugosimonospora africana]